MGCHRWGDQRHRAAGGTEEIASVLRVRSLLTLRRPDVRSLIVSAVTETAYPGTTPERFYAELASRIIKEALGVFVGFDEDEAKALAVALLPTSAMMIAPQVCLVYSRGKPALIRAVAERLKAWIMASGYDRVMGLNLYRDDTVFMRGFRYIGQPRRLGSVIELRF